MSDLTRAVNEGFRSRNVGLLNEEELTVARVEDGVLWATESGVNERGRDTEVVVQVERGERHGSYTAFALDCGRQQRGFHRDDLVVSKLHWIDCERLS